MSRIIVKSLPKHITAERLKKHFSKKGEVTDVKLVNTKDGIFRRFGYVGFKTEKQALDAVEYFNNTFIDTSRIQVEVAKSFADSDLPRAWSKYSKGSLANERFVSSQRKHDDVQLQNIQAKQGVKHSQFMTDLDAAENDPKIKEFLETMRSRGVTKGRTWTNDDLIAAGTPSATIPVTIQQDAEDELYEDLASVKKLGQDSEQIVDESDKRQDTVAFDPNVSDLDYLKSKMKKTDDMEVVNIHPSRLATLQSSGAIDKDNIVNSYDKPVQEDEREASPELQMDEKKVEKEIPLAELIADTGRLMLRNLPFSCTSDDVETHFKKFGPIAEVHIPIDKVTKESKGYGFVLFMLPENAVEAYVALDKSIFQGRILDIIPSKEKPRPADEIPASNGGSQSFKSKREQEKKSSASNDFNWNSLFMNPDSVADAMAKKLGVKKSDILDRDADNVAVRLALAETNIINETKQFLEDQGVAMDKFSNVKARSKTVMLVKNIPSNTEEDELIELFGKFGELGRVILPPARTIAMIEFIHLNEAKTAFRRLAYSKFKNIPLYLEWAPQDPFTEAYDAEKEERRREAVKKNMTSVSEPSFIEEGTKEESKVKRLPQSELENDVEATEEPDLLPVATVFIKNLNFSTTEEGLRAVFGGLSGLRSIRIAKKPDPKTGGKLSMGFGFLEFMTKEMALKCIKALQHTHLDGHELHLKLSTAANKAAQERKRQMGDEDEESANVMRGSKLIVRNVPFEATKKDLKDLFSSFGQVKTVRIPRKFDGQHRGFAFIDFATKREAKTAYESLGATHLYGRHLVLEWAQDDESVDAIRGKTARSFVNEDGKRRKVEMEESNMDQ